MTPNILLLQTRADWTQFIFTATHGMRFCFSKFRMINWIPSQTSKHSRLLQQIIMWTTTFGYVYVYYALTAWDFEKQYDHKKYNDARYHKCQQLQKDERPPEHEQLIRFLCILKGFEEILKYAANLSISVPTRFLFQYRVWHVRFKASCGREFGCTHGKQTV